MEATAGDARGEAVGIRLALEGEGRASISTGVPMLDHLVALAVRYGGFDLALEVAPGAVAEEVAAAGRALGEAFAGFLHVGGAPGHASAVLPAADALAHVVLEAAPEPLLVSNVDLTEARLGGLGTDLVATFLAELAEGARLTLHVRLLDGDDAEHVLEAIFKALGVALAGACRRG